MVSETESKTFRSRKWRQKLLATRNQNLSFNFQLHSSA